MFQSFLAGFISDMSVYFFSWDVYSICISPNMEIVTLALLGLPLDMFSPLLGCHERLLLFLDSWPFLLQCQCLSVECCLQKSSISQVHLRKDKRKNLVATSDLNGWSLYTYSDSVTANHSSIQISLPRRDIQL